MVVQKSCSVSMWKSISNVITSFGQKKDSATPSQTCQEYSDDDDIRSNESTEEGLECPICWESFNIVENIPYVLWCGHSLCKNCLLGLKSASVKISTQQIQIPLFVSCPWCNLLTLRLFYQGNLKFPSKNFFLLWMVESRNGDRMKSPSAIYRDQLMCSSPCTSNTRNPSSVTNCRRAHLIGSSGSGTTGSSNTNDTPTMQRTQFSLQKSLDFFFRLTSKFPLVVVLLLCGHLDSIPGDHNSLWTSIFASYILRLSCSRLAGERDYFLKYITFTVLFGEKGRSEGAETGTSGALGGLISMLWSGNVDALFIDGALLAFSATSLSGLLSSNVGIFLMDGAFLSFSATSLSGLLPPNVGIFLKDGAFLAFSTTSLSGFLAISSALLLILVKGLSPPLFVLLWSYSLFSSIDVTANAAAATAAGSLEPSQGSKDDRLRSNTDGQHSTLSGFGFIYSTDATLSVYIFKSLTTETSKARLDLKSYQKPFTKVCEVVLPPLL
ncbi:hypothetical protein RDI58_012286 [Solanum bulbocastanum]|uniref:RING-type domain-containing protein n=1 Tax=Solanum bulbocastanum TaxID=147425 RepID=A0AAN8YGK7_SOLBU